jgi:hypothetical protein
MQTEATPIGPPPIKSRCLIGVNRVVLTVGQPLPVYPRYRTFLRRHVSKVP